MSVTGDGEQTMLSLGHDVLAPVIVETLLAAMQRLRAETALAILLVEQHASRALDFAESTIVLDRGKVLKAEMRERLR